MSTVNSYIVRPPRTKILVKEGMVYWAGIDLIPLLSYFNLLPFLQLSLSNWSWLRPGAISCAGSYLCVFQSEAQNELNFLFIRPAFHCQFDLELSFNRDQVLRTFFILYTIIIMIHCRKYLLFAGKVLNAYTIYLNRASFINLLAKFCVNVHAD